MSDWFGGGKTETKVVQAPSPGTSAGDAAAQLRLQLAQAIASGDWSAMQGFFDKVLIPGTRNTMTAQGLGRSGAIGEAVTREQLAYGGDFLKTLLTGIPISTPSTVQTQQYQPGGMDWLMMGLGALGGGIQGWKRG